MTRAPAMIARGPIRSSRAIPRATAPHKRHAARTRLQRSKSGGMPTTSSASPRLSWPLVGARVMRAQLSRRTETSRPPQPLE